MSLHGKRILLTGASGGIGRHVAQELARDGALLVLVGRERDRVQALADAILRAGGSAVAIAFDLASPVGHAELVERAAAALGGLDVLVNNAGVQRFGALVDEDPAALAQLIAINLTAPLLLTRAALMHFDAKAGGQIVNVGSTFGAIGFPQFAAYSASKFALRGMSEALRRELPDRNVCVSYISPRATATDMNSAAVRAMQEKTRTRVDDPVTVAKTIVAAIADGFAEKQVGWPERFFVKLNALLPRLVDGALIKQGRIGATCARAEGNAVQAVQRSLT